MPSSSSSSGASSSFAEDVHAIKSLGNARFQAGRYGDAIVQYQLALDVLDKIRTDPDTSIANTEIDPLLRPTIWSNLALVHLKRGTGREDVDASIQACSEAINCLDGRSGLTAAGTSRTHSSDQAEKRSQLRCKVLYRRAKARFIATSLSSANDSTKKDGDDVNTHLNAAARDLLDVLQIDAGNKEAAALLSQIRAQHQTQKKLEGSEVAKALASLRECTVSKELKEHGNEAMSTERALKVLMGLLVRDGTSHAMELGRRGGVSVLVDIIANRRHIGSKVGEKQEYERHGVAVRVLALHVLSAACSHGPFVRQYAHPKSLDQEWLAHVVSESCAGSGCYGAEEDDDTDTDRPRQIAVAAMALFLRLVIHLDHTDDKMMGGSKQEISGPSVCRAIVAGLSAPAGEDSTTCHRASLDLLSAWTASDMDAMAAAAESADVYLDSSGSASTSKRLSETEMNQLKPKEFAAYKKKMYTIHKHNDDRAKENAALYCDEQTGGLAVMLDCAVSTANHALLREIGSAIGRLMSGFEEDEDVMKLVAPLLGFTGAFPSSSDEDAKENDTLTIEEVDETEEEEKESQEEKTDANESTGVGPLMNTMKRGQLVSSLLLGRAEVGVWALKSGWDNGFGLAGIEELISSGNTSAMSIASEILSAAASVEKARPLLTPLVEKGCIEQLLTSDNREVRSGAASAIAKLGLANKDVSSDEGEVFGLLQIAAELITGTDVEQQLIEKTKKITISNDSGGGGGATAIDRGIEVLSYLCSKTNVKEEIAHGFKAESASTSVLERLVELGSAPEAGESSAAYGLASIFSSIAVSNQTLRDEAFTKADITSEQYDQLQSLGKTEEEKELDKNNQDVDPREAVNARILRMANANVPRVMVKLMDGASDTTKEMIVSGMNRFAVEQSVRGQMIQQGCLSCCLKIEKSEAPSDTEKKTWFQARHCVAKLLVTTNPALLTVSQRMSSVGPLIQLIHDHESTDLSRFEALMAITNLASVDDETKNRVVAEKGISRLGYAMFSDHEMVRRAATEAMSNLIPHPEMVKYLEDPENIRLWVAFARDFQENLECSRAAIGGLAMATNYPNVAAAIAKATHFSEMTKSLLECGNLELMHRVLVLLLNMSDHGGEIKDAVLNSGSADFCRAYVQSYHDGSLASELNFTIEQKGALAVTVNLAKEIIKITY